ncbi:MAG: aminotransferase class I/II-fold pyridoxal phosphate-dependent enzyme, partial [Clostridia bacterium]|nr:aminotransferase class I/II-fold pyridoxal phosphate-dependent enzyme [Clostridia bacterium]
RKIAALEGADGALCFGAGMGAITASIMRYVRVNCHIIMVTTSYPDAKRFALDYLARKFGVRTTLLRGDSVEEIAAAITDDTTLIYLESPSTSVFKMQDLEAVAALAKPRGIGTVIDNSYATPLYQQPLKWGIDISLHTVSKYLCGHSNVVGGVVCSREEIIREMQNDERALYASLLSPMDSYLLTMSLRTLPERMCRHGENGRHVAAFLESHPRVDRVFYPGSATYGQKDLFEKYMSGTTGLLSFVPRGTPEAVNRMIHDIDLFVHGPSWGGYESIISGKSVGMTPERCKEEDLVPGIVRLNIGLENVDTVVDALDKGLKTL